MSGPEHYQKAEIALDAAAALQAHREPGPSYTVTEALLDALVHATLAEVYAHNRATTELTGLLHTMLDQLRELREAQS